MSLLNLSDFFIKSVTSSMSYILRIFILITIFLEEKTHGLLALLSAVL